VRLPHPPLEGEFPEVLLGRRTWRGFSARPLPREDLAKVLHLTWGIQGWARAGTAGPVAFKTAPSGGGRHSIEAYVAAVRVQGVPSGLYHYRADNGNLERLRRGASARELEAFLCGQWWYRPAAAVVFMTAVLPRVWWRYPTARAFRSVMFEAGHLCQTFCLVSTWLRLAPFCTAALDSARLEAALGVDGRREVLLYAAGLGTRPADGKWVQWPRGRGGRRAPLGDD
jgi:SagB-type dehydrogenase family enzyme